MNTWHTYSIGFSNLTEAERDTIELVMTTLVKTLSDEDICVEGLTSDSGEM